MFVVLLFFILYKLTIYIKYIEQNVERTDVIVCISVLGDNKNDKNRNETKPDVPCTCNSKRPCLEYDDLANPVNMC